MTSLDDILARLEAQAVLCVGDLMLDEFVYGDVTRISPEAASPVLAVRRRETQIGGAGNVARNVASLGARCLFVGVIGDDEEGRQLAADFTNIERTEAHLIVDTGRVTTHKMRFVSEHHSTHLLRADWENDGPLSAEVEGKVLTQAMELLPRARALLLSDYAKGVLTPRVIRTLIDAARAANMPVIVDPKGLDYTIYRGATLITPNRKELSEAAHLPVADEDQIAAAAAALSARIGSEAVLVTRSEDGMSLHRQGKPPVHVAAHRVRVRDVSGAGDTVAAVLGAFAAAEADLEEAMRAANAAAAIAVGKRGTATVSAAELRARMLPTASRSIEEKLPAGARDLEQRLAQWRSEGLRVGFTNGCFDLLHPGHVRLLSEARAACDRLIVGLNSDSSVRGLKGPGRPVQDQQARAAVLAALEAVDLVVIFDEATPLELIRRVRPTVLVKGSDYRPEDVVGRDIVEADGGELILVELVPGHSSTRMIEQSRRTTP